MAHSPSSLDPPAKKATTATLGARISKSRQTKLDLEALISGYSYNAKAKARPRMSSPADTESTIHDLTAALDKEFGPLKKSSPAKPAAQSKLLTPIAGPSKPISAQSNVPTIAALSAGMRSLPAATGAPEIVDFTSPNSTIKERSPNQGPSGLSPDPVHPTSSPKPISLIRPLAVHPSNVQLLEMLAAEHDLPGRKSKEVPQLPEGARQDLVQDRGGMRFFRWC